MLQVELRSYYIQDLGIGWGTFVKLETKLILRNKQVLNIGETFISVNLISHSPAPRLQLKLYSASGLALCHLFDAADF